MEKRIILFKGKTINGNRLIEGSLLWDCYNKKKRYYILPDSSVSFDDFEEVHPDTVSQFTGLTDKNGVKIFEGDKLKTDAFDYTYIVEFTDNAFNCYHETLKEWDGSKLKWGGIWRFKEIGANIEAIGSVHD